MKHYKVFCKFCYLTYFLQPIMLNNPITPNVIRIKTKYIAKDVAKALQVGYITKFRKEILFWFYTRDILKCCMKLVHAELTFKLHLAEFWIVEDSIRENISHGIPRHMQSTNIKNYRYLLLYTIRERLQRILM